MREEVNSMIESEKCKRTNEDIELLRLINDMNNTFLASFTAMQRDYLELVKPLIVQIKDTTLM